MLIRVCCLIVCLLSCDPALAAKKVALVIGNSLYKNAPLLNNPRNDAQAVAQFLIQSGFDRQDVRVELDLGYDAMRKAILAFGREARNADAAVIYYAGHGFGSGVNYLIPVDAELKSLSDLPVEAISQRSLEEAIKLARGLKLVVIDACRNDPSRGRMADLPATRSVYRGLERVEPDSGVLVLYSAKHGTVAQDGPPGGNSPFASALIGGLGQPGKEIRFAVGAVRDAVIAATNGEQEPYLYGSLGERQMFLVEGDQRPPPPPSPDTTTSLNSLQMNQRMNRLEEELKWQKEEAQAREHELQAARQREQDMLAKQKTVTPTNVCGWYAIHYCSKVYEAAASEAKKFSGYVIDTSDPAYPKFTRGWYCSVLGPMSKSEAQSISDQAVRQGFPTSYIKNPC